MEEDSTLAVLLISQAVDNGIVKEAKKKSEIAFKVKDLNQLEHIRNKAEKILTQEHNQKIAIDFTYTTNPSEIARARPKHPNKIFHP